jgi:hypothetical protein
MSISPKLKFTAGYLLGLSLKDNNIMDVCTEDGFAKLNILLYYCKGYGTVFDVNPFDDNIYAGYIDNDNHFHDYPIVIKKEDINSIVPITFVTSDEIKSFKFDDAEYLEYIKTILDNHDYELFENNYKKKYEPINFTSSVAFEEFKFLKTIMDTHNNIKYTDDVLWNHDTPDHPFQKHLMNYWKKELV